MLKHSIQEQLILHEGLKTEVYSCPANKLTIGVGRNLEAVGLYEFEQKRILENYGLSKQEVIDILKVRRITQEEALFMLNNDIMILLAELENSFRWFNFLNEVRQKVVLDMRFNLGSAGFLGFKNMIRHIENMNYWEASEEMKNSKWFNQVGTRAERLIQMMATGQDYNL